MTIYRGNGYCCADYTFRGYDGGTTPPDYEHDIEGLDPQVLAACVAALCAMEKWRPTRSRNNKGQDTVAVDRGPKPPSMDAVLAQHGIVWEPGAASSGALYLRYEQAARQRKRWILGESGRNGLFRHQGPSYKTDSGHPPIGLEP